MSANLKLVESTLNDMDSEYKKLDAAKGKIIFLFKNFPEDNLFCKFFFLKGMKFFASR